jgi:putative ABC transport system ATP-binding protein
VLLRRRSWGGGAAAERRATARSLLEQVGLGHRLDHMPNMLSGGEQQRVTIARALANTPPLLLLDEPTGDLDTRNTRNVVRMLRHLNEDLGVTLVMVTHDMYLKNYASRVLYMRDGKLLRTERIRRARRAEAFRELDKQVRR